MFYSSLIASGRHTNMTWEELASMVLDQKDWFKMATPKNDFIAFFNNKTNKKVKIKERSENLLSRRIRRTRRGWCGFRRNTIQSRCSSICSRADLNWSRGRPRRRSWGRELWNKWSKVVDVQEYVAYHSQSERFFHRIMTNEKCFYLKFSWEIICRSEFDRVNNIDNGKGFIWFLSI